MVGEDGAVPDPLPDPSSAPAFGQPAPDPCWRGAGWVLVPPGAPDGAVVLGAVVLGAADGSGLAADTTATAPPTSSSAESAAVMTARRMPEPVEWEGSAIGSVAGVGTAAGAGAGTTGGVVQSMGSPSVDSFVILSVTAYAPLVAPPRGRTRTRDAGGAR